MWSDVVAWLGSAAGQRVIDGAVVPALAILVAGLLAAWIARRALRATIARLDQQAVTGAVASALASAERPAPGASADADVRLRMLPLPGAPLAADWAGEALAAIDRGDAAAPSVAEVRDRLLAWVAHPKRAQALFAGPKRPSAEATPAAASAPQSAIPAAEQSPAPAQPAPVEQTRTAAVAEPESGPLTEPVVVHRAPDPALLAAVEREIAGSDAHARHARPVVEEPASRASAGHTPAHRDRPVWADDDEDDDGQVVAEAGQDAPEPVLVSSLGDRRFAADTLVPDGAVPVSKSNHRARP